MGGPLAANGGGHSLIDTRNSILRPREKEFRESTYAFPVQLVLSWTLRSESEIFKNSWGDPPTPHPPHLRRGHRGRRGLQGKNKIRPRPLPVSPKIEVKVFRLTPRSSAPLTPGGSNFGDVIEDPHLYHVTKFGRKLLCGGGATAV